MIDAGLATDRTTMESFDVLPLMTLKKIEKKKKEKKKNSFAY